MCNKVECPPPRHLRESSQRHTCVATSIGPHVWRSLSISSTRRTLTKHCFFLQLEHHFNSHMARDAFTWESESFCKDCHMWSYRSYQCVRRSRHHSLVVTDDAAKWPSAQRGSMMTGTTHSSSSSSSLLSQRPGLFRQVGVREAPVAEVCHPGVTAAAVVYGCCDRLRSMTRSEEWQHHRRHWRRASSS